MIIINRWWGRGGGGGRGGGDGLQQSQESPRHHRTSYQEEEASGESRQPCSPGQLLRGGGRLGLHAKPNQYWTQQQQILRHSNAQEAVPLLCNVSLLVREKGDFKTTLSHTMIYYTGFHVIWKTSGLHRTLSALRILHRPLRSSKSRRNLLNSV